MPPRDPPRIIEYTRNCPIPRLMTAILCRTEAQIQTAAVGPALREDDRGSLGQDAGVKRTNSYPKIDSVEFAIPAP